MEIESGPINENEERRRPGVERVYRNRNGEIAVLWEPKLCIHAGYCFRGLPEVFQPESRPWVKVDAATADKIAEVVMTCPTGALHFERLDGGPQEPQRGRADPDGGSTTHPGPRTGSRRSPPWCSPTCS